METKRKRVDNEKIMEETDVEESRKSGLDNIIGPKNVIEAGPGSQALPRK